MLGLLEGLERVCRAHSSGILYGVSVNPAVGFEVEAAMGDLIFPGMSLFVCFKDLFCFKITYICLSVYETVHMSVGTFSSEEDVRFFGAGVKSTAELPDVVG